MVVVFIFLFSLLNSRPISDSLLSEVEQNDQKKFILIKNSQNENPNNIPQIIFNSSLNDYSNVFICVMLGYLIIFALLKLLSHSSREKRSRIVHNRLLDL